MRRRVVLTAIALVLSAAFLGAQAGNSGDQPASREDVLLECL